MTGNHFGACIVNTFKCDHGMKKNGGLCYPGLFQIFFSAVKHDIRNTKPHDLIRLFKQSFRKSAVFIMVFSHPRKLRTLSREHKSMCHNVKRGLKNKNATKVLTIQKEVFGKMTGR